MYEHEEGTVIRKWREYNQVSEDQAVRWMDVLKDRYGLMGNAMVGYAPGYFDGTDISVNAVSNG